MAIDYFDEEKIELSYLNSRSRAWLVKEVIDLRNIVEVSEKDVHKRLAAKEAEINELKAIIRLAEIDCGISGKIK